MHPNRREEGVKVIIIIFIFCLLGRRNLAMGEELAGATSVGGAVRGEMKQSMQSIQSM